jgi:hypothetical protein
MHPDSPEHRLDTADVERLLRADADRFHQEADRFNLDQWQAEVFRRLGLDPLG